MAGTDERDDVGAQLLLIETLPGFRVPCFKEQRQEIMRRLVIGIGKPLAPHCDDRVDRVAEEAQRRPRFDASDARDEIGKAEKIERVDTPRGIEIARNRLAELLRPLPQPVGENRALKYLQRDPRHLVGDIEDLPCPPARGGSAGVRRALGCPELVGVTGQLSGRARIPPVLSMWHSAGERPASLTMRSARSKFSICSWVSGASVTSEDAKCVETPSSTMCEARWITRHIEGSSVSVTPRRPIPLSIFR